MKTVYEFSDFNEVDTHIIVSKYEKQLGGIIFIEKINNGSKVKILGDKSDGICFVIDKDVIKDVIADFKEEAIEWYNKKITDCISLDYIMGKKIRFICIADYDLYDGTDGTDGYEVIIKTIDDVVKEYIKKEDGSENDKLKNTIIKANSSKRDILESFYKSKNGKELKELNETIANIKYSLSEYDEDKLISIIDRWNVLVAQRNEFIDLIS